MDISIFVEGEVDIFQFLLIDEDFDPLLLRCCCMMSKTDQKWSRVIMPRVPPNDHNITGSCYEGCLIEGAEEQF